jgi:hypothetical protein
VARIAIIKLFYGMSITGAQLAGQLKAAGHEPLVIFFSNTQNRGLSGLSYEIHVKPNLTALSYPVAL